MAKKIFIFVTGTLLICMAWMGVVSSIEEQQNSLKADGAPIKVDLMQSRWQRLSGFKALEGETLKKPAKFMFTFTGLDMDLTKKLQTEDYSSDLHLDVKSVIMDGGNKSSFYTFESTMGDQFLLRAIRIGEELTVTGFDLDSSLNFFGQGLEESDWFVVDAKKRVLASSEKAYVGKTKTAGKNYQAFSFVIAGKDYEYFMPKETEVSLGTANFMGVLGIVLVMLGLYHYTEGRQNGEGEVFSTKASLKEVHTPEVPERALNLGMESEIIDDELSEDIRMVDLSASKSKNLDYTDFLIENPILAKGAPQAQKDIVEKSETPSRASAKIQAKEIEEVESVTSDEWVKLAEELSANIDKFTESAKKAKKDSDQSKADA